MVVKRSGQELINSESAEGVSRSSVGQTRLIMSDIMLYIAGHSSATIQGVYGRRQ